MKLGTVHAKLTALAATVLPAGAFDLGAIPPKVVENLSRTPSCAMSCIFDPHWIKTYAPECSQLPLGAEYGSRLCRNFMYQFMIDTCIKSHCSDEDRRTVSLFITEWETQLMVGTPVGEKYLRELGSCGRAAALVNSRPTWCFVRNLRQKVSYTSVIPLLNDLERYGPHLVGDQVITVRPFWYGSRVFVYFSRASS